MLQLHNYYKLGRYMLRRANNAKRWFIVKESPRRKLLGGQIFVKIEYAVVGIMKNVDKVLQTLTNMLAESDTSKGTGFMESLIKVVMVLGPWETTLVLVVWLLRFSPSNLGRVSKDASRLSLAIFGCMNSFHCVC